MATGNFRGGATADCAVICEYPGSVSGGGRLSICAPRPAVSSEYKLYAGAEISAATEPAVSRSAVAVVAWTAESAAAFFDVSDSSTMQATIKVAAMIVTARVSRPTARSL